MSLFNNQSNRSNGGTSLFASSNTMTNNNTAPSGFNTSSSGSGGGLFSSQGTSAASQGMFGQSNQATSSSPFGNNSGTTTVSTGTGGLFSGVRFTNTGINTASNNSVSPFSNNTSSSSGLFASSGSSSMQSGGTVTSGSPFPDQSKSGLFQPRPTVLESSVQQNPPVSTTNIMSSPPKLEFSTTPEQIKALFPQMLKNQSTASSKFTISNDFGKIEFEGNRDVKEKDLDALSGLKQRVDFLINNNLSTESAQLSQGEKLDRPATVTLYNCFGERGNNSNNKKYEEVTKKMGYEFIEYDEVNRILKLKVMHL